MARVVVQRVRSASVTIGRETVGAIGKGLAILIAIREGDETSDVCRLADKLAVLRVFEDEAGKMNLSAAEAHGDMLVISQFTLYADVRKGRRPSFARAANPGAGRLLYEQFAERLSGHGYRVESGRFGDHMLVTIENDGPVTIIIDSDEIR